MRVMSRPERATEDAADRLVDHLKRIKRRLSVPADLDPMLERIGDARFVLLGEASHGTSEFYMWRAQITKRLIREKGFSFVAVEGDWPDCYRVNRFVKGYDGADESAYDVLHAFNRWPSWMWANWEMVAFVEWLREHNQEAGPGVGFYGLDVYSLWESMEEIIRFLEKSAPESVPVAKSAYRCFEPFDQDVQSYAWSTAFVPQSCEQQVIDLLAEMRRSVETFAADPESKFNAVQNALVAAHAEHYYRTMMRGRSDSWNVRDEHMVETLERLMEHHGPDAKGIVWAHNTHVGDATATDMAASGMVNIGQLVRDRHFHEGVVLVGFGSNHGSVIAADEWGAPMEQMEVPVAEVNSWEDLMTRSGEDDKLIMTEDLIGSEEAMTRRGHRAIGVVYDPAVERYGNYVPSILPLRYDMFLHIDETRALNPLHLRQITDHEPPETYPWGI
jgi:erythromycin esterase-like protein